MGAGQLYSPTFQGETRIDITVDLEPCGGWGSGPPCSLEWVYSLQPALHACGSCTASSTTSSAPLYPWSCILRFNPQRIPQCCSIHYRKKKSTCKWPLAVQICCSKVSFTSKYLRRKGKRLPYSFFLVRSVFFFTQLIFQL